MNPYDCEVVEIDEEKNAALERAFAARSGEEQEAVEDTLGPGFELLPQHLERAARQVLKGRTRAFFSRTSGGKLSRHASFRRRNR